MESARSGPNRSLANCLWIEVVEHVDIRQFAFRIRETANQWEVRSRYADHDIGIVRIRAETPIDSDVKLQSNVLPRNYTLGGGGLAQSLIPK